ncbi:MAG: hypothetical protein L3K26_01565, partial [Candidatus Hydrogenedentes bacterium]|nr:hypothetical protein [Candidatus Hydrogenedentota bacterium]
MKRFFGVLLVAATFFFITESGLAQDLHGIPLKPDPPIAVDGDLGDWSGVPNVITIDQPDQAVFGAGAWTDASDMSGTVRLAWRREYLFLGVTVTDDVIAQGQRASGIWQGDHVELYIDVEPDREPERTIFGAGQFQIALSPGNFQDTGDALVDTRPEVFCFRPRAHDMSGVLVASTQTASGWVLEAAIPWSALGVTPEQDLPLRIEVGLSDTDVSEAKQETLLTSGTAKWEHTRARLYPMALAGSDGVAKARATSVPVFGALEIAQGKEQMLSFDAPPVPEGRQAVLRLMARLHSKKVGGHTQALRFELNGQRLSGNRLLNKKLRETSRGGRVYSMSAGDRMATYYSPDFDAPNSNNYYGLLDGVIPCLFELDVTDLVKTGANELIVQHAADSRIKN